MRQRLDPILASIFLVGSIACGVAEDAKDADASQRAGVAQSGSPDTMQAPTAIEMVAVPDRVEIPEMPSAWVFKAATDPMTDESSSYAATLGSNGTSLRVGCESTGFYIYADFNTYMGSEPYPDMRARFDNKPVSHWATAQPSTDGTAYFVQPRLEWAFLKDLKRSGRLIVEGRDSRGSGHRATFSLRGATAAINELGDCIRPPDDYGIGIQWDNGEYEISQIQISCYGGLGVGSWLQRDIFGTVSLNSGGERLTIKADHDWPANAASWLVGHLVAGDAITIAYSDGSSEVINADGEHAVTVRESVAACWQPN